MKIFGHHIYAPFVILIFVEVLLAFAAFIVTSVVVYPDIDTIAGGTLAIWAALFSASVVTGIAAMGLYQPRQRLRSASIVARLVAGIVIAAVVLASVDFLVPADFGGLTWVACLGSTLVLLAAGRLIFGGLVDHEAFRRRVLVYGAGKRAGNLLRLRRQSDQRAFRIVAFIPAAGDEVVIDDDRVAEPEVSLLDYAREHNVSEIVVAMDDRRQGFPVRELLDCSFAGIDVIDILGFLERETGKLNVDLMNPAWLIFSVGLKTGGLSAIASRALDLIASVALLIVSIPFMIGVVIAIMLEDGRPVLYRQERVGLRGRAFTLYKFRSMRTDAESDGKAQWASLNDDRTTKVGAVIRKFRLDELPQVFNVLRGDMSLVGPRPERPKFVEQLASEIPYYHERHSVKPGITGWAQLCYPYGSSENDAMEKLQFDLYYVKYRSLIFDLAVLLQTAEVIILRKGAR